MSGSLQEKMYKGGQRTMQSTVRKLGNANKPVRRMGMSNTAPKRLGIYTGVGTGGKNAIGMEIKPAC